MLKIEFVFDGECPNVSAARSELIAALATAGEPLEWTEWRIGAPGLPEHVQGYGSPTILVNGMDAAGQPALNNDTACRVYADAAGGVRRTPGLERIIEALRSVKGAPEKPGRTRNALAVAPALAVAAMPKLACPACWPAYSGLLSSVGLGVLIDAAWLLPLTALFLAVAVAALAWGARRRGFAPLVLGAAAAGAILAGKFGFDSDAAMWSGILTLAGASAWNSWPTRQGTASPCPRCAAD